jgi:Ca2+-binding RTX toxin-like protein
MRESLDERLRYDSGGPQWDHGALAAGPGPGDKDDVRLGTRGDDVLGGGPGDDLLIGGPGDDRLDGDEIGATGNDTLLGGRGDDTITGWGGQDLVDGGRGDDLINLTVVGPLLPPFVGDGEDTVLFTFAGASGRGIGDDTVTLRTEDRIVFLDVTGRVDTLEELAAATRFTNLGATGSGAARYRLDWAGDSSIVFDLVPTLGRDAPGSDIGSFASLADFATAVGIGFGDALFG